MKAAKIIEYLKQFDSDDEISISVDIEVPEEISLEDVNLSNFRLTPFDNSGSEPLVFNTHPVKIKTVD